MANPPADAVPKKRGPKTDVLEALLKRVDGLEKRLKTDDGPMTPSSPTRGDQGPTSVPDGENLRLNRTILDIPADISNSINAGTTLISPATESMVPSSPTLFPEGLIDIYFQRLHGKPLYILDEMATRSRLQNNTLPSFVTFAIYALSARFATSLGGFNSTAQLAQEYAHRARAELDLDEPSVEGLQALLLLSQAAYQCGKGKRAYMYLSTTISMAFALNLHRELPNSLAVSHAEREGRRRLFWACYTLDRFASSGTKRPSLISDDCILLRLPGYQMQPSGIFAEGEYFPGSPNLQFIAPPGKATAAGSAALISILRILGKANRYLASGGVKGDSHFPWHTLSTLSKLRQDLDLWATETQETFASPDALFGQPDSIVLVLSKLIYHLIHCLIHRPFLPLDLNDLSGTPQHQSWQLESTNTCFLHANAITELVEIGKVSAILDWPAFVGYCVCTAGTIHVHGAHYRPPNAPSQPFSNSADLLTRDMQQLSELRFVWTGIQHQYDTLQIVFAAHSDMFKSLGNSPVRFSAVFQLEDFFDRYPGVLVDGAYTSLRDVVDEPLQDRYALYQFALFRRLTSQQC